jgi:uncharacterized phage infection (PIP) family protein YhgE
MSDQKITSTEEAIRIAEEAFKTLTPATKEHVEENKELIKSYDSIEDAEVVIEEGKTERELTDFEKEQQALGWRPDGEKSAKEWAAAYPVYNALKDKNKEIKQLKQTLDELKAFMDQQKQQAYNAALDQINRDRAQAISKGDHAAVDALDKQRQQIPVAAPQLPQAVYDFKEKNKEWLEGVGYQHMEMAAFAKKQDEELFKRQLPPERHFEILQEHMEAKFPDYFKKGQSEERQYQSVEGNSSAGVAIKSKMRYTFHDLTDEQKTVAKHFERNKVMTVDKYISELVAMGEIRK